jgi:hypothetical protein
MVATSDETSGMNTLAVMAAAVIGSALAPAILLPGAWATPASRTFVGTFGFRIWLVTLAAQTAFWGVIAIPLWRSLGSFREEFRSHKLSVFGAALGFIAILVAGPYAMRFPRLNPMDGAIWKVPLLSSIGALGVGIPALAGMALVHIATRHNFAASPPSKEDIERFVALRNALQQFLLVGSTVIGLTTLATGVLRNALLTNGLNPTRFPPELVLLYGAFFTAVIALAYVPAYKALVGTGRRMVQLVLPMPEPGTPTFGTWYSARKLLLEFLQLEVSVGDRLRAGIIVLAPLTSALLSIAIPKTS